MAAYQIIVIISLDQRANLNYYPEAYHYCSLTHLAVSFQLSL